MDRDPGDTAKLNLPAREYHGETDAIECVQRIRSSDWNSSGVLRLRELASFEVGQKSASHRARQPTWNAFERSRKYSFPRIFAWPPPRFSSRILENVYS